MAAPEDLEGESLPSEQYLRAEYRYRSTDGLPGDEGAFLACTFWLAHA